MKQPRQVNEKKVVAVFGLPGTGKSFFAEKLSAALHAAYLNTDIVREQLQQQGRYTPEDKAKVYAYLLAECRKRLSEQQALLVVDGTFSRSVFRDQLIQIAQEQAASLYWIRTQAGEDVVRERVSRKRAHSEADFQVYLQVKAAFEEVKFPHLLLDTEHTDIEEMLAQASAYIFSDDSPRTSATD